MDPLVILISENEKEAEILNLFFSQRNIQVVRSSPSYANYIRSIQYNPAVILIEVPENHEDYLKYLRMIKSNKKTLNVPVIAFGDHTDKDLINKIRLNGTRAYYSRPLKTGRLMQEITGFLRRVDTYVTDSEKEQDRGKDMSRLLDKKISPLIKLEIMVGYIKNMLAFPFTIAKVLEITQSSESGAAELAKAIQADPVITTTILKVANSVFFSRGQKPVTTIRDAIVRIGFEETKNITMSISVMKLFSTNQRNHGFNRVDFWYHSLACAVLTERIAKNAGYQNPNEAFIAGLLHDFGIILLDEFFGEIFEKVLEETTKNGTCFIEEENNVLGVNHNDIIEKLFTKWRLSENIICAIRNQNSYTVMTEDAADQKRMLSTALGVTHVVVKSTQIGQECDCYVESVANQYMQELKYPAGFKAYFWEEFYSTMNMYIQFLKIEKRKFPHNVEDIIAAKDKIVAVINRKPVLFNPIDEYLKIQGYSIRELKKAEEIERLTPAAHCVIVHALDTDHEEDLSDYCEVMNSRVEQVDLENPEYLPVVVFYGFNSVLKKSGTGKAIKKYGNSIDLRHIDEIIKKVLS